MLLQGLSLRNIICCSYVSSLFPINSEIHKLERPSAFGFTLNPDLSTTASAAFSVAKYLKDDFATYF